jgi:solute carrier family 44 protein 1 (choline transporter-like protein)/choline transporter-like protein 2/4/5
MKLWFMFFCLLWTMNFISNFGSCVISHSVATWYFTYPENRKEVISNGTIWESYKLVLRKHFGTIALGSLLIGLVQFARSICLYIQKNLKKGATPKRGSVKTGPMTTSRRVGQVVCCCISCCLCCFETFLKYISKQAYIQTAIHGYGFIGSGKASIDLILKNILRVGGITFVSEFVLLIGKLFVTMLAAACSYIYISEYFTKDLYDPVAPTIMVAILAWMTATMFMDVLHMSVDTVFCTNIGMGQCLWCTIVISGSSSSNAKYFTYLESRRSARTHHESKTGITSLWISHTGHCCSMGMPNAVDG